VHEMRMWYQQEEDRQEEDRQEEGRPKEEVVVAAEPAQDPENEMRSLPGNGAGPRYLDPVQR